MLQQFIIMNTLQKKNNTITKTWEHEESEKYIVVLQMAFLFSLSMFFDEQKENENAGKKTNQTRKTP